MANVTKYKDLSLHVGDTLSVTYKLIEGDKTRQQVFKGILLKITGKENITRMITVRKISKIGLGVERIIPLESPNLVSITIDKVSNSSKAKLYFLRNLTEAEVRRKLYSEKK